MSKPTSCTHTKTLTLIQRPTATVQDDKEIVVVNDDSDVTLTEDEAGNIF